MIIDFAGAIIFTIFVLTTISQMKKALFIFLTSLVLSCAATVSAYAVTSELETEVEESAPELNFTPEGISISNPGTEAVEVFIYAITGVEVTHFTVSQQSVQEINLASGYYIVRIGKLSHRIAIK